MLETALLCLALNVYHEARGEPEVGQLAVAFVTLNRAHKKNTTVCKTVLAKKQFSWTNKCVVKGQLKKGCYPKDQKAWAQAMKIAIVAQEVDDHTYGANHYHRDDIAPDWITDKGMKVVGVWGRHVFYRHQR